MGRRERHLTRKKGEVEKKMTSKSVKNSLERFFPDTALFWKEKNMPISGISMKDNKLVMSVGCSQKIMSLGTLNMWIEFLQTHDDVEVVVENKGKQEKVTEFVGDRYGTRCNVCTRENRQMTLFDLIPQRWLDELPVDENTDPFAVYVPNGTEVIPVFR